MDVRNHQTSRSTFISGTWPNVTHNAVHYIFILCRGLQSSGSWNDGVSLLLENERAGLLRRNPIVGPSEQELKYEPDYFRFYGQVWLVID